MNAVSWRQRLKISRDTPSCLLPKLTKAPSVSSVSKQDGDARETEAENAGLRLRLLAIARAALIDDQAVTGLPDDDINGCVGLSDDVLRAYVLALRDSLHRERGRCPEGETARAMCKHCGPIWLSTEVAACAPAVDGWPQVLGCPWCHVKNRRAIPRPEVTCGECTFFERDRINPDGGLGRCGAGLEPETPYPHARRQCEAWRSA